MSDQKPTPESCSDFDVAIIGGGMAGSIAASGLAALGLHVALIDAIAPQQADSTSFDQRSVALSASSIKILESLNLWSKVSHLASPITDIHISEQGQFGFARLSAEEHQLDALGQVIQLDTCGPVIWEHIRHDPMINLICPAQVTEVSTGSDCAHLKLQSEQCGVTEISAKLVLVADGTYSKIAEQLNFEVSREPYNQVAIVANVIPEKAHNNKAFERFTSTGPLALLPLPHNQMSLVWCRRPEELNEFQSLSETEFLEQLQQAFGFRLGKFQQVSQRITYPLASHWPKKCFQKHFLLMGNAAHTLHPIAGQGINLGLRDIAFLIEKVSDRISQQDGFYDESFLSGFVNARKDDWQLTHLATDSLARLFCNDFYPLTIARNKGLVLFNRLPKFKQWLGNAAMGFSGNNAKLARGFHISELVKSQSAVHQQRVDLHESN